MMLDMDEWYLLFQPQFENYLESINLTGEIILFQLCVRRPIILSY